MQHTASRPLIATGTVLSGAAVVAALLAAPTVPGPTTTGNCPVALTSGSSDLNDFAVGDQSAAATLLASESDNAGWDVADLDSLLKDIGLGSLVANNDFFLQTDATEPIGQWFFETASAELLFLFGGVDGSTLTAQSIMDFTPAIEDIEGLLSGTGDFSADLSQLLPDISQGVDDTLLTAVGLFLSA